MNSHEANIVVLSRLLREQLLLAGRPDQALRNQLLDLEAQITQKGNS